MKRSVINEVIQEAAAAFERHGWALPPNPRWDVTDMGLGNFNEHGLVLVNLTEQPEYCEKLMYARHKQVTPAHCHKVKKEDIICRWGTLNIKILSDQPTVSLQVNGEWRDHPTDELLVLNAGERVTLTQEIRHSFWTDGEYVIIGEVSTANDDAHDNYFDNPDIGRFSEIEEDEPARVKLVSD